MSFSVFTLFGRENVAPDNSVAMIFVSLEVTIGLVMIGVLTSIIIARLLGEMGGK
jgi:hypothetical protein